VKESDETYSFYAVDLQGGPPQQLASGASGVSGGFSPDGSQVLVGLTKEGAVNIYLMDADGGNRTLLLSDKYAYGSFLPDGQSIFVVAGPSYDDASLILFDRKGQQIATLVQNSELVVVMPAAEGPRLICWTRVEDTFGLLAAKADGSDRLELVSGLDVVRPFISDDGQRALYLAQRGDVIALHRVDLESGQDQELFRRNVASNQALSYGARLSEDWRWLLYDIRDRDSETNKDTYTFYLANVESGEQVKLTGPADSANGEFFPDSRRLWFVEQITPESEQSLYVAEANGSKPVRLAWGQEVRASFAPDGESLVVSVKQDDAYSLYVMSADGARQNKLVDPMLRVNHDCQGVFSPDRQRTLVRNVYGQYADELWTDLYLLNPDGSRKVLAEGAAWVVNGQFSADGQVLVFDSNRDGGPAVYRAAADGSDVRLIGPGGTLFSLFGADRSSRFYYPVPLPTRPAATPESSATETPTETPVPTETAIPTETAVACNPSLSVYFPSSEQVEISGSGWPPNELVSLAWGLGFFRTELGTVSADSSGSFSKTFNTKDVSGMLSKGVIMADSGSCDASADYDRP
jgi:Tol biopolymer transport system component